MRASRHFYHTFFLLSLNFCFAQQSLDSLKVPGFSVDIRFLDALDPARKSVIGPKEVKIFEQVAFDEIAKITTPSDSELRFEFIQTAHDFEHIILNAQVEDLPVSANFSQAYKVTADAEKNNKQRNDTHGPCQQPPTHRRRGHTVLHNNNNTQQCSLLEILFL